MISDWEYLNRPNKGSFSTFSLSEKCDISKIIDHELKIGLRVACNSLSKENKVFEKKLPKLSQVQISWSFGKTKALIILLQDKSFVD